MVKPKRGPCPQSARPERTIAHDALVQDLTGVAQSGTLTDMSVTASVRDRLLTAAVEVFAAKGYTATRVSDIVGQAGVAQGTFYLYFRSKQAIFEELLDTCFSRASARAASGRHRQSHSLAPARGGQLRSSGHHQR